MSMVIVIVIVAVIVAASEMGGRGRADVSIIVADGV